MPRMTNTQKTIAAWVEETLGGDVTVTRIRGFKVTHEEGREGWDNGPYDCAASTPGHTNLTVFFDAVNAEGSRHDIPGTPYWSDRTTLTDEAMAAVATLLNDLAGVTVLPED